MSDRDYMAVVRNLLAKAESTNHPAEAEALLAKAQELMSKHTIDEAMLTEHQKRDRGDVGRRVIVCEAPYAAAKFLLLGGVARANDCRAVRLTSGAYQTALVFGYERDLEHVEALHASLSLQATRAMLGDHDSSKSYRRSFLVSFARRVSQRLAEARRQGQRDYERAHAETGGSVAVVLADKSNAVDTAVNTAFPNLRTIRVTTSSVSGAHAGQRAADRADLGGPRVAARKSLPGG